jgi:hypothetical protein
MPCPYFEPQRAAAHPQYASARLPLIEEYEGVCHAGSEPFAAPADRRFRHCNHGYSRGLCGHFPESEQRSGLRYDVLSRSGEALQVLWIEEQAFAPVRWQVTCYSVANEQLEPEIEDCCVRAQLLAFCRSYMRRFPITHT